MSENMRTVKEWSEGDDRLSLCVYRGEKIYIQASHSSCTEWATAFISSASTCESLPWRHREWVGGKLAEVSLNHRSLSVSAMCGGVSASGQVALHDLWPVLGREFPTALNEALAIIASSGKVEP